MCRTRTFFVKFKQLFNISINRNQTILKAIFVELQQKVLNQLFVGKIVRVEKSTMNNRTVTKKM